LCVSEILPVVMFCCVSVTVCSLLLSPVVCQWQFAACCYVLLCVSDSLQLVVMSCCVSARVCRLLLCFTSVTVCSLLLGPVVCQWQFAACSYVLFCVSDSFQPVDRSCCLSVTVCSLFLCSVVCQWQFAACCLVLFCVSDSLQLVDMFVCVSVTVCRWLLCPVVCQWDIAGCYVLLCVSDS